MLPEASTTISTFIGPAIIVGVKGSTSGAVGEGVALGTGVSGVSVFAAGEVEGSGGVSMGIPGMTSLRGGGVAVGAPDGGNGAFAASFFSSVGVAIFCVAFAAGSLDSRGEGEGVEPNFPQPVIAMSRQMIPKRMPSRFIVAGKVAYRDSIENLLIKK